MKKFLTFILLILLILITIIWFNLPKLTPYYTQLTKTRVGLNLDLQPKEQKEAEFVGSGKCKKCHEENYHDWKASMHSKMIQEIKSDPSVVVADFSQLPSDADFTLAQAVYTIGSKFKQRYMIPATINGKEDFRLGNYQWNSENKNWQHFKPYKYWYKDSYPHEGSKHVENPDSPIFKASLSDPMRTNEVCFQCHMRNRDKRIETKNMTAKEMWMTAKDYPEGYEPGKALISYKLPAPFALGEETKEFWANGAAKKNRTQGNEYIHDRMYQHGITCINCHNPHKLTNTAKTPKGNDACMKCHSFGSIIGPHQVTLEEHTQHKEDSKGSLCIECHMPKTAKHTGKSPFTVRSHLFSFTYTAQTKAYGMPPETNACYACHKDKTLDSLQNNLKEWGKLEWEKLEIPQLDIH
jgi:nitrate/TMAO reductase-like tetraheme cytochrome c subunit